ncbi:hypothetical protein MASR2M15_18240 [Anaerolineales bacterium]
MPTLTRYFIKAGMIYLGLSMIMLTVMLFQPLMGWSSSIQALRPLYFHFLFIGWVTQLIMGVGYWMFPKYSKEQPRRNEKLGWATFITLNIGLIFRSIGEPGVILLPQANLGWALAIASLCLLFSGWAFVYNSWGRVRER